MVQEFFQSNEGYGNVQIKRTRKPRRLRVHPSILRRQPRRLPQLIRTVMNPVARLRISRLVRVLPTRSQKRINHVLSNIRVKRSARSCRVQARRCPKFVLAKTNPVTGLRISCGVGIVPPLDQKRINHVLGNPRAKSAASSALSINPSSSRHAGILVSRNTARFACFMPRSRRNSGATSLWTAARIVVERDE